MNKIVLEQNDINVINDLCKSAKENGDADNLRLDNIVLEDFNIDKAEQVQHGWQFDLRASAIDNLKRVAEEAKLKGKNRDDYQVLINKINNLQYTSQVPGKNAGIR